jgi:predicted nucleotidyltransferase
VEEILLIQIPKQQIDKFCKQNHIKRLSFFGSVLRDDFSSKSDIDILVEFDPAHIPSFFQLIKLEEELSIIFKTKKVDLRTPMDLSRYFRNDVLAKAKVIYVEN